jgi:hypothetical protein
MLKEYLKKMNNISVPTDKKKLYEEKRLTNMRQVLCIHRLN